MGSGDLDRSARALRLPGDAAAAIRAGLMNMVAARLQALRVARGRRNALLQAVGDSKRPTRVLGAAAETDQTRTLDSQGLAAQQQQLLKGVCVGGGRAAAS